MLILRVKQSLLDGVVGRSGIGKGDCWKLTENIGQSDEIPLETNLFANKFFRIFSLGKAVQGSVLNLLA